MEEEEAGAAQEGGEPEQEPQIYFLTYGRGRDDHYLPLYSLSRAHLSTRRRRRRTTKLPVKTAAWIDILHL